MKKGSFDGSWERTKYVLTMNGISIIQKLRHLLFTIHLHRLKLKIFTRIVQRSNKTISFPLFSYDGLATLNILTIHISFSFHCVKTSSDRATTALFTYLFQSSDINLQASVNI